MKKYKAYNKNYFFHLIGNLVDEMSPKVKVEPDQDEVELNFKVKLPVEVMDKNYFRTICSNPILGIAAF